jgi:hypothetical protein
MTNLRNELPVAVHVASGGEARVRTGGQVISLDGVSSGSFQVSGATRFKALFNARSTGGLMLLMGYTSPVTPANASIAGVDFSQFCDDVPEGTTVYYSSISLEDLSPSEGAVADRIHISFYG